jgi:LmbE family N-acetylglucosaminyl deacetylase
MAGRQVAVIAAHPDDELLGAGGTVAWHGRRGDDVHAIVAADGAGSRYPPKLAITLEKQARRAAGVVGFASLRFLALPDQRLDTIPLIELTQRLEEMLDDIGPRIVYTHFPEDVNDDHRVVAKCAWVACRPYRRRLGTFAVFETPSSTEWAWPLPGTSLQPNLFVDITGTIDVKVAAMECYETELRDYPHPRSARALRERAAYWGSHVGCLAAEPFRVLREVA